MPIQSLDNNVIAKRRSEYASKLANNRQVQAFTIYGDVKKVAEFINKNFKW